MTMGVETAEVETVVMVEVENTTPTEEEDLYEHLYHVHRKLACCIS